MSYPVFLIVGLAVTILVAGAIAGPLSGLCVIGFWVVHWLFVNWLNNEKNVKDMSDSELHDVLNWWTRGNVNIPNGGTSALDKLRRTSDKASLRVGLARVIGIYGEMIFRNDSRKLVDQNVNEARDKLIEELAVLKS